MPLRPDARPTMNAEKARTVRPMPSVILREHAKWIQTALPKPCAAPPIYVNPRASASQIMIAPQVLFATTMKAYATPPTAARQTQIAKAATVEIVS